MFVEILPKIDYIIRWLSGVISVVKKMKLNIKTWFNNFASKKYRVDLNNEHIFSNYYQSFKIF